MKLTFLAALFIFFGCSSPSFDVALRDQDPSNGAETEVGDAGSEVSDSDSSLEDDRDTAVDAVQDASPAPDCFLVDDLAHDGPLLPPVCDRTGSWFDFNDGTPGTQDPPPSMPLSPISTNVPPPSRALHVRSTGFTGAGCSCEWGSGWGFYWRGDKKPYDVGTSSGISFLARVDPGLTRGRTVTIAFPDADTSAEAGCVPAGGKPCGDHFLATMTLSETWARYEVRWEELKQEGWGKAFPAFDFHTSISVVFLVPAGVQSGTWVADVRVIP